MRGLTDNEFSTWLSNFDAALGQNDNLTFCSQKAARHSLLAYLPKGASELNALAPWLIQWLPKGHDRVLWLKRWMTYPPDNVLLFERLRRGCGEPRGIAQAPGHLFGPPASSNFDDRTSIEIEDNIVLATMVLFIKNFDWDAYLVAENCDEYIYLSDECVSFSSPNRAKLDDLADQLNRLKCQVSWIKAEQA